MKKLIHLLFISLMAVGCQQVDKPAKPDDLIAKELMVDIFTDVYLSNAAKSVNNKVIRQRGIKLDSFIYKKYRIDSLQFVNSNAYYSADLDTYQEIFKAVEARLTLLNKELDSLNFKKNPGSKFKQKQDSIKKANETIPPVESD